MRKINLPSTDTYEVISNDNSDESINEPANHRPEVSSNTLTFDRDILLKANPEKLLYSIRETAKILCVSYEFVRAKVFSGQVNTRQFGARKFVHVTELSRLVSEGIP